MAKFQSLINFQYEVMNVWILLCPKIATLLYHPIFQLSWRTSEVNYVYMLVCLRSHFQQLKCDYSQLNNTYDLA